MSTEVPKNESVGKGHGSLRKDSYPTKSTFRRSCLDFLIYLTSAFATYREKLAYWSLKQENTHIMGVSVHQSKNEWKLHFNPSIHGPTIWAILLQEPVVPDQHVLATTMHLKPLIRHTKFLRHPTLEDFHLVGYFYLQNLR